jgi:hypothetical protein
LSDITAYIAITIADSRIEKARKKLREKLLQQVQLEGGHIVEDDEGVLGEWVQCPACVLTGDANTVGEIEVRAPFGLEERQRATYEVDIKAMQDDVLLWAIKHGLYKVTLDTKVFDVFAEDPSPESLYHMGIVGSPAHLKRDYTSTLNVISADKLKEGS